MRLLMGSFIIKVLLLLILIYDNNIRPTSWDSLINSYIATLVCRYVLK